MSKLLPNTHTFNTNTRIPLSQMKSFKSYSLNLLNNRQLAFVAGTDNLIKFHLGNPNLFTTEYQSRSKKKSNPEYYSFGFIIEAVHNSEKAFEQYPKDEPKLKKLAHSIFDKQHWLIKDVTIAFLEHKPYIVGGRHRIDAIANVLSASESMLSFSLGR